MVHMLEFLCIFRYVDMSCMFKRIFLLKNTDVMTNFGNIFFYVPKLFIHSYDRRFGERGNSDIETTTKWSRDLRRRSIRRISGSLYIFGCEGSF